jgi:two-component sensor histidine kinase
MNFHSISIDQKISKEDMEKLNKELEKRVIERTASLSKENEDLKNEIAQNKVVQNLANKSFQEKIIFLKEIHHTVKSNIQVISSLLNIQSGYRKDDYSFEISRENKNLVRPMSFLCEKRYLSRNFILTEFSEYINSFCTDLFNSNNIDASKIKLNTNLNGTLFEIDKAILCCLIINELISNSLKHAFPGDREGEITIETESYNDEYILIIRDNGIGFPAGFNFKKTNSCGLQLVNALTMQLKGEIELINGDYTEFKIIFPQKLQNEFDKTADYEWAYSSTRKHL